jgi:hypothetical protein
MRIAHHCAGIEGGGLRVQVGIAESFIGALTGIDGAMPSGVGFGVLGGISPGLER